MSTAADQTVDVAGRRRSLVAIFLVVLASVGAMVTPVAWSVHTSSFDTDAFIGVVEPVFENEEVASALGEFVAEEVVLALDLQARIEARLGIVDEFLAEDLADALELSPPPERCFVGGLLVAYLVYFLVMASPGDGADAQDDVAVRSS